MSQNDPNYTNLSKGRLCTIDLFIFLKLLNITPFISSLVRGSSNYSERRLFCIRMSEKLKDE